MSKPLRRLESEILSLSHDERAQLARLILLSLESDPYEDPETVDEAWAVEIERRVAELRSGRVQTIPGEHVLGEIEDLTK